MTTKRSDQDNLARIVQLLSAQRVSDVRNEEIRNFSIMLLVIALIVNLANIYHTQVKVIQYLQRVDRERTCTDTNSVSPWWMAVSIQYPIFARFYENSHTPRLVYYLINLYGDTWLRPSMLCGTTVHVNLDALTSDPSQWYDGKVNPFATAIPFDAPIVKDYRGENSDGQKSPMLLTTLCKEGFIRLAESATGPSGSLKSSSYIAIWDYCFTEQSEKKPCHKDVAGFWGSVFSNATSGAFLGDMSGGPVGMLVGFGLGGVLGWALNQDKLDDC